MKKSSYPYLILIACAVCFCAGHVMAENHTNAAWQEKYDAEVGNLKMQIQNYQLLSERISKDENSADYAKFQDCVGTLLFIEKRFEEIDFVEKKDGKHIIHMKDGTCFAANKNHEIDKLDQA